MKRTMDRPIARRDALRHLAVLSAAAVVPGFLVACSKKPSCEDVSGLAPADLTVRRDTAQYVDTAADPAKKCSGCAQYIPAAPNACGGCKVVKGPINPEGGCKLFVPKPA
jgi:hypothetical protein